MVYHVNFAHSEPTWGTVTPPRRNVSSDANSAAGRHTQLVRQCAADSGSAELRWLQQTLAQSPRALLNKLEIDQLQAGIVLHRQPINLAALLHDIVATHAQYVGQKGLQIDLISAISAPDAGRIQADQLLLHRALKHILDNAVHFTLHGGTIDIRVERTTHHARIAIRDTGIGIEAHALPHIFRSFFRTTRARHYGTQGNGLGLAISQLIIEAHGGTINVMSEPNRGSTFTIILPLTGTSSH